MPEYHLYLAIDDITYISFFKRAGMEFLVQASQLDLLVVDVNRQEIVEWNFKSKYSSVTENLNFLKKIFVD